MSKLIDFFINRSFVVNLVSAFIILAGIILGSMIKRDLIPPFEFKLVNVTMSLPGASATEVEKYLAYPVENALKGLSHVTEITTQSSSGSLRVSLYFHASHDEMNESVEQIRSRISSIQWQLPQQSRELQVRQEKVDSVFHMGIALENFKETETRDRQLAKKLSERINAIPGIIDASLVMNNQNVYVKINPKKLSQLEISVAEVRDRIQQSLLYSPIGQVDQNEQLITVEVQRPTEAIEALKNLAIRSNRSGDVVFLKDLAEIKPQVDQIKNAYRYSGKPAINIYTRKDIVSDAIALKGEVIKVIDQFNSELPPPLKAEIFMDGPRFIELQLSILSKNAIFGMILVLLILTIFFNWKVSLAASFGIPIAYCGTLIALYMLNISIDLISVVGMILVLGILVDDAIIISERYIENLEEGLKPKEAARAASKDLMLPVTGTILTTIFAFAPMVLIESEIATIFYAVPIVIITSLAMSWFESFFILPNHMFHFIKKTPRESVKRTWFDAVKEAYERSLSQVLRFRYLALVALIGFFVASAWVAKHKVQQSFMFNISKERISVKVTLKDNISLAHTQKVTRPIEDYLLTLPKDKFDAVQTSIGQMWHRSRNYTGYRYARFDLHINDQISYPNELKKEFTKILTKKMEEFKTDQIELITVGREMNDQDETKKDMVTIEVSGNEDVDYLELKESILSQIKDKKHQLELVKEVNEFDDKWIFKPDTNRLAQHQMSLGSLTEQLRSYFVPHELMQIRIFGETQWIYTEIERADQINESQLNKMSVLNSLGLSVPLRQLGSWVQKKQLSTIQHKNGKRMFTFDLAFKPSDTMNITLAKEQGKNITTTMSERFPSYEISLKDADRAETSSRAWALKVALLCIALVMFTLALILGSITLPFIVGLPIPFGLMGIVWALYLHDMPMGMMSLVGLIGTVGVSVNDSLIMVDQMLRKSRKIGRLDQNVILKGASSRLRAIILTTVTTLGGVFPMAYGIGGESGFTQPLAFSLGWGLFFSTFLTLFALPAFILILTDAQKFSQKAFSFFKFTGLTEIDDNDTDEIGIDIDQKMPSELKENIRNETERVAQGPSNGPPLDLR